MTTHVLPPRSEEIERTVLAALLALADAHPGDAALEHQEALLDRLQDAWLEGPRHRAIAAAARELVAARRPVDVATLGEHLRAAGTLDDLGGVAYLAALSLELPDLGRVRHYLGLLSEVASRRELSLGLERLQQRLRSGAPPADVAAAAEELASRARATEGGFRHVRGGLESTSAEVEARANHPTPDGLVGLPSGFCDLDRLTLGFHRGNLLVLAGRPGMGKTAFALDVARTASSSLVVGFASYEMSESELNLRLVAQDTGIDLQRLRAGYMSGRQWDHYFASLRRLAGHSLFIDDTGSGTVAELASRSRALQATHGLDLLIVDGLWLMEPARPMRSRVDAITEITRGVKRLSRRLKVPILLLHQLSRQTESRSGDHRPRLADLRESGSVEQDADLVAFIYRDEVYNPEGPHKGTAELIVAKQRQGPTGTVHLAWRPERTSFASLERTF